MALGRATPDPEGRNDAVAGTLGNAVRSGNAAPGGTHHRAGCQRPSDNGLRSAQLVGAICPTS